MAFSAGALQFVLVNVSLFAVYALWVLFSVNDGGKLLNVAISSKTLPGTNVPLKTVFTGVPQLDGLFVTLNTFFWTVIDGSSPTTSLHILQFGGQYMAAYALFMLEGLRQGNKGRAISYVMLWGLAFQGVGIGIFSPILLAVALSNTSMLSPSLSLALPANSSEAFTIPISLSLCFILPSALMALPAPAFWSHSTQQNIMVTWQIFPILSTITQQVFKLLSPTPTTSTPKGKRRKGMNAARFVYGFTLFACAATHVASLAIAFGSVFFPMLFKPEYVSAFNPSKMAIPAAITPASKVSSVAEAVLLFLQWDEITSTASLLLYAGFLLAQKCKPTDLKGWAGAAIAAPILDQVIGPVGLAVLMIWVRDEILYAEEIEKSGK